MAVNIVQYEVKIKKLFAEFLVPTFQLRNDVYLNTLLSHFSGKDDKELGEALLNLPCLSEWLVQAVLQWETTRNGPSPAIGGFTLQLAGLLSQDQSKFLFFKSNNIYGRLYSILKLDTPDVPPTIKLGYIKLLTGFLNHKYGVDFLSTTEHWKEALKYCLTNQTVYITREGSCFMYTLLEKCMDNEMFCDIIIKEIMSTLKDNHIETGPTFPEIKDEYLQKRITPTLHLLTTILESYLASECFKRMDFRLLVALVKSNDLEQTIWNIVRMVHNKDLLLDLDKILFIVYFLELASSAEGETFSLSDVCACTKNVFQIINDHLVKGEIENALKLCYYLHYTWQYLKERAPPARDSEYPLTLENQVIVLQIMPIFSVSCKHCNLCADELESDDIRDNFVTKLFKIMCERTIRMCYSWRTIMCEQTEVFKTAHLGITYLMKSHKHFSRNTSIIVFQGLMYGIKDIAHALKSNAVAQDTFSKQIPYMISLIDSVSTLISEYNITWRDCIETICVMTYAIDLLSCPIWPPRLIVQMLKLLNISITKFMAPNLALLVDQGTSTMDVLGPLLYMKLHDRSWEVRDTALEVVHSICGISLTKFLSFQKIILESELPTLVVTMSMADGESFVRASAIKCLQEMIKVPEFWSPILEKQQLLEKMMKTLSTETEANVRCEAASLICKIYEHQYCTEEVMNQVYEAMCYAAISDLHWEVKLNALNFWEKVICNHLQHQGMIDGTFPNVTFSKEHRKIVTLTGAEVQNRLNKVLVHLSNCKCLTVLLSAMQDDCDLEVMKKAVRISQKLADLLNAYNIKSTKSYSSTPLSPSTSSSAFSSPPVTPKSEFSEEILNEIINAKDINLLSSVYSPSTDSGIGSGEYKPVKLITADTFVSFLQKDLSSIVAERAKWLNGIDNLGSLLDDMLKSYEEDVNSMDCY